MLVRLPEELSKYTEGFTEVTVKGSTPKTALTVLFNTYPNLYMHLMGEEGNAQKYGVVLDDEFFLDASNTLEPFTELEFIEIPSGADPFTATVMMAEAFALTAEAATTLLAVTSAVYATVGYIAVSVGISYLAAAIIGKPDLGAISPQGTVNSPSASFAGVQNTTNPGTVVPVVYGKHRTGGQVLSVSTYTTDVNKHDYVQTMDHLKAVLALSEGPIKSIGGIKVNGFPENYYDGWEDPTKISYTLGGNVVNDVVTPAASRIAADKSVKPASLPGNVFGSMEKYGTIENTNSNVNNSQIKSIASLCTYDTSGITEADWEIDTTIDPWPVYGTWSDMRGVGGYVEYETHYDQELGSYVATWAYMGVVDAQIGGASQLADAYPINSGYNYPGYSVVWSTDYNSESGTTYSQMFLVTPSVPGQTYYSSVARDKAFVQDGLWYYRREYVNINKILKFKTQGATLTSVLNSADITKITTNTAVVGFRVSVTLPQGLYGTDYSNVNDPYTQQSVVVGVFKRKQGDTNWTSARMEVISNNHPGEISRDINIESLSEAIYEIAVTRFDEVSYNSKVGNDVRLKGLTEIITAGLGYPYTALMAFTLRATDQLQGQVPTVSSLVEGRIIQVPDKNTDGSFKINSGNIVMKEVWSDNPVWCLFDLLTHDRYGLKEYFPISATKKNLMIANFDINAQYCDYYVDTPKVLTVVPYVANAGSFTVVNQGSNIISLKVGDVIKANGKYAVISTISYFTNHTKFWFTDSTLNFGSPAPTSLTIARRRFSLNLVLDQSKSAADWVETIKSLIRASVWYSQGAFWIDIDRPQNPAQIFNLSNLKDFTLSNSSYKNTPNVIEVQYPNPDNDYAMDVARIESQEYMDDPTIEERKKVLNMVGCTSIEQVKSMVKFVLAKSKLGMVCNFKTGTEGLRCQVNSVIGITHDSPQWGNGGRIVSVSTVGDTVTCATDVTIDHDKVDNAKVYVTDYRGNTKILTVTVEVGSNTTFSYSKSANSNFIPNSGESQDVFAYGISFFRITSIQKDSDFYSTITASEYNAAVYTAADDTSDVTAVTSINYSDLKIDYKTSIDKVRVEVNSVIDNDTLRPNLLVTFLPPKVANYVSANVYLAVAGTTNFKIIGSNVTGTSFAYKPSEPNGDYVILVTANYFDRRQAIADAINDSSVVNTGPATFSALSISKYFSSGVRGLSVEGDPLDNYFYGKDCIINWRKPTVYDQGFAAGDTPAGVTNNSLLDYYTVEIKGTDGSLRRKVKVTSEKFIYTHEMNHEDGISRSFTVTVVAFDTLGRTSDPVMITCSNPAPAYL